MKIYWILFISKVLLFSLLPFAVWIWGMIGWVVFPGVFVGILTGFFLRKTRKVVIFLELVAFLSFLSTFIRMFSIGMQYKGEVTPIEVFLPIAVVQIGLAGVLVLLCLLESRTTMKFSSKALQFGIGFVVWGGVASLAFYPFFIREFHPERESLHLNVELKQQAFIPYPEWVELNEYLELEKHVDSIRLRMIAETEIEQDRYLTYSLQLTDIKDVSLEGIRYHLETYEGYVQTSGYGQYYIENPSPIPTEFGNRKLSGEEIDLILEYIQEDGSQTSYKGGISSFELEGISPEYEVSDKYRYFCGQDPVLFQQTMDLTWVTDDILRCDIEQKPVRLLVW